MGNRGAIFLDDDTLKGLLPGPGKTVLFLTFKLTRDFLKNLHLKRKETFFTNEKFSKVNALRKRKGTSVVRASGFCKSPSEKEVRGLEAETGLSKGLPS